ncbi:MAG: T9SS type A sorting domain-containing protein [Bacteroidales bacterium]|nr:T9SS type A sorting domain-containing protein [Bacteroidales bacterium]MCF8457859.1 T9SS type A sorting domain-containing protein [Bacteroidales bacterium]
MKKYLALANCVKFALILIVSALIPFNMFAEWVPINPNQSVQSPPKVTILSDDMNSTVLKIEINGFNLKNLQVGGKTYQTVDLLSDIFSTEAGYPELPYISKVLAVPDQASVSVEIIETGDVETYSNIYLPPARVSWYESQGETPYTENPEAYQSMDIYPANNAALDPPAIFRDFRIARVSLFPVRYLAFKKELQVASSITIRVNYGSGVAINPKTTARKAITPSFGKLYQGFIFNYLNVLKSLYNGVEDGQELMLCIMPDEFVASFQVYADWKRESGTNVHITKFTDINANASNPDIIKNHIADAYNNWPIPPSYVLIVGDNNIFPKKVVNYDYSFPNEDYFVEIEGNDFFPEMMIGRFTNQGDYRMQVMINKFMKYEKDPYVTNTDWFKKGICCSNNEYESQVETKRYAAEMMTSGGFTVDTLMSDGSGWGGTPCSMDLNDVTSAIDEGRSWLNYRGEGWSDGWHANCYFFDATDVTGLNNGEKLTFVTSIGCGVAMFSANGGNCFGEEWIQLGTLTNFRGAVAFVGPTSNTHTTYNNKIDKGIYSGMFQEGMETPGTALLRGKLYMYNVFGNDPWVEYHYRVYCVLGDPSIHIWKDIPQTVAVSHPATIAIGYNQVEVTVTFGTSGAAVANAQVCLSGDAVFMTGTTDSLGKVFVGITPLVEDTLTITVRGGNVIPYQGTIAVVQTAEHVGPNTTPVIVDIDGNQNGTANPNENCNITFSLMNWGLQTASNVQATLTSSDPNVQVVTTSPLSFGNLAAGGSFTGSPFQYFILPTCPIGHVIILHLHVTSNTSSWDYQYSDVVNGCDLVYLDYVVNDDSIAFSNYRMDPGETVKLFLKIENIGEDVAPNTKGILYCNDPYITIEDSMGTFGSLGVGAFALSQNDYFKVSVDASCPVGYLAEYTLKLYTEGGPYPYEIIRTLSIPVGLAGANDYTGPDLYGYYAYSSDDVIFEQAPVYDWMEINTIGTELNMPSSDYTQTITIPFTFKYYSMDYTELRVSTDGWIAFGSGSQTAYENTPLPNNDNVDAMAAVFWDDLHDNNWETGKLFYYNDVANHRLIVQWDSIAHYNDQDDPDKEVFQAILLDPAYYLTPTGDGELIFQYSRIIVRTNCTVGIENKLENIGLQYVYNNSYDITASVLKNDFAIKFTTVPPFSTLSDEGSKMEVPGYSLGQNYPNPFSPNTWISYSIPKEAKVELHIFDISGQLIRTLQNQQQAAGNYTLMWNGLNNDGDKVSSGVFFYRLQTDEFVATKKLFMLK